MLANELRAQNVKCIAVESTSELSPEMKSKFNPDGFSEVIQHQQDLDQTLQSIRQHQPTHVIPGFESGVELADWLSNQLSLPCNEPKQHDARRDKFRMTELVRADGLRTAKQFRSNDVEEILCWIRDTLAWPVIVKPLKSVASDHVFCCSSADEVRDAAEAVLSQKNVLGSRNAAVLVQEFLNGTEYAIDIVNFAGQKKITAIWQYYRPPSSQDFVCYDAMTLLPYTGNRQDALRSYAFDVMDALGIQFGPAHCELMWVDGEPVFVEVGVRMSAGINATLSRICGGICQLDKTVEILLSPDRFLATLDDQPCLEKRAVNVFLIPQRQGRLLRARGLDQIQKLPTLHSMSAATKPGEMLSRVAGLVTMVHEDIEAIQRDVGVIRSLEREGIFEVEHEVQVEALRQSPKIEYEHEH